MLRKHVQAQPLIIMISRHKYLPIFSPCSRYSPSDLQVRVGSTKLYEGGQLIDVEKCIINYNWSSITMNNDFALLKLSEKLNFSSRIAPILLPRRNEKIADGTKCSVSGWGLTQNSSESRENLRQVTVPIVNQEKCSTAYSNVNVVTKSMICAGYMEGGRDCEHR